MQSSSALVDVRSLPFRPMPARRVGEIIMMSFLENLEIGANGDIVVTSMLDGRLWGVRAAGGAPYVLGQVEGHAVSVASAPDSGWLVFGRRLHGATSMIARVAPDGSVEHIMDLPDVAFPNGVQRMPDGHYLLADSMRGIIWDIDYPNRKYAVWLQDERLDPGSMVLGLGVNGMKVFQDRLYISSTGRGLILSVHLDNGKPSGPLDVVKAGILADDFAFDVNGVMYLTTHPQDLVLRLAPDGDLSVIAGAAEGVRGCTACRFGRAPGDETGLYVVTDGGLLNPMSGGFQPALVVRLEIGAPGAPVDCL